MHLQHLQFHIGQSHSRNWFRGLDTGNRRHNLTSGRLAFEHLCIWHSNISAFGISHVGTLDIAVEKLVLGIGHWQSKSPFDFCAFAHLSICAFNIRTFQHFAFRIGQLHSRHWLLAFGTAHVAFGNQACGICAM